MWIWINVQNSAFVKSYSKLSSIGQLRFSLVSSSASEQVVGCHVPTSTAGSIRAKISESIHKRELSRMSSTPLTIFCYERRLVNLAMTSTVWTSVALPRLALRRDRASISIGKSVRYVYPWLSNLATIACIYSGKCSVLASKHDTIPHPSKLTCLVKKNCASYIDLYTNDDAQYWIVISFPSSFFSLGSFLLLDSTKTELKFLYPRRRQP